MLTLSLAKSSICDWLSIPAKQHGGFYMAAPPGSISTAEIPADRSRPTRKSGLRQARSIHDFSAPVADSGPGTVLCSVGLLDVIFITTADPLVATPCPQVRRHCLVTKSYEKYELVTACCRLPGNCWQVFIL